MPRYHYIRVYGKARPRIDVDELAQALLEHDLRQLQQEEVEEDPIGCAGCDVADTPLGQADENTTFYIVEHYPAEDDLFDERDWA